MRVPEPRYNGRVSDQLDEAPLLEVPVSLPPDGGKVWYFPGALDQGGADIVARIRRRDSSSWIACLNRSPTGIEPSGDIFAMPCGERLFIAGGIVDRDDPASWRSLEMSELLRASWSPDRRFVVFHDHTSLCVYGSDGFLWSHTLGSDSGVSAVTEHAVVCNVYDWASGRTITRRFDLRSGREINSSG